jgi:hypothetical protein
MKEQNALANLKSSANSTEVTLQQILAAKTSPALSELKKNKGEQTALGVLVAMMDECQQYFNLQQPMNAQQLMLTAELIMEEYYYLRIEELRMCFRMAMKGEFGPVYNRIDGQVFFEWIIKYMPKRQLITDRMKQEQQSNNNIYDIFAHPQMAEALQQVSDKLLIKQVPVHEEKRSKLSNFEQLMMDEYDELPLWGQDIAFRLYNTKPYQFTEYRKERYRELIEQQNEY